MRLVFPLVVAVYPAIRICQGLVRAVVVAVAVVIVILWRRGLGRGGFDPEGCGFEEAAGTGDEGGSRRRRRKVICRQRTADT